jgi:acid stress-induced BolA-like protein IbaG/YrbA
MIMRYNAGHMIEAKRIEEAILGALDGATVELANPRGDGLHFDAVVVASQFVGKSLIEQQRLVMGSLTELFGSSLHAMSLKTYTPDEWEKVKP